MATIKHVYTHAVADGTATSVVRPSDWNSAHAVTMLDQLTLGGNTAGVMGAISSGTVLFAGGDNVTLSQNGNSITVNGATVAAGGSQSLGMSNLGNTSGTTGIASGGELKFFFAGGNSITLSQSLNGASGTITIMAGNYLTTAMASNRGSDFVAATAGFNGTNASGTIASNSISVSVAAQTVQTVGLYASSNTYLTSSGTVDARSLTFRGDKSITVGVSAGEVMFSVGAYLTTAMASNRGTDFVQATAAFAGTNATGTIASNGISVSVNAGAAPTLTRWQDPLVVGSNANRATSNGIAYFFEMPAGQAVFPGNITMHTVGFLMSGSHTATNASTEGQTYQFHVGIYTVSGTSTLNLLYFATTTFGGGAASDMSSKYNGLRYLTLASSQWSDSASNATTPALGQSRYIGAFIFNSAGTNFPLTIKVINGSGTAAPQMSGTVGASVATATTMGMWPFGGELATAAIPVTVNNNAIRKERVQLTPVMYIDAAMSAF